MEPILYVCLSIYFWLSLSWFIFCWSACFFFWNVIQVHPAKLHPKAGGDISICHIIQTIPQHQIYIFFKTIISNRTSEHFIFTSSTNCMKHIINHNMILGIYIPSSQVLYVCYQGIIIVRKIQNISNSWVMIQLRYLIYLLQLK